MGTEASPKRYFFFFFFKSNYTNFKSISLLTFPTQTKRGGVAFKQEKFYVINTDRRTF